MHPFVTRNLELAAMVMIGDGLLAMVDPPRHAHLWRSGPLRWRRSLAWFEDRPSLTAAIGLVELCAGLWLARRQMAKAQQIPVDDD